MTRREPLIVDFAPHDIHYAGAFDRRWFASLLQYPSLLAFDESGRLLQRIECPNVETVVEGRFAIGSTRPRVKVANVQRAPELGPHYLTCHDLLSGKELWRRESSRLVHALGTTGIVRSVSGPSEATALVDLSTGTALWETGKALDVHAHDQRNVYVEDREGVLLALDRQTGDLVWTLKPEKPRSSLASVWLGGIAAGADGVWYVHPAGRAKSRIIGLSTESGKPIVEHSWAGTVSRLVPAGKALLAAHDHGVALVRDGAIAPFVEHLENPIVEAHANGFVAWNGNVLVWAFGLDRSPVRVALEDNDRGGTRRRYDWESFRLEQDDAVLVARTRMLRIPLAAEPAARLVAPVTVPSIGEFPLEKGTVFFAGDARVLIEHASRGRFWFDVAESGLVKGEVVEIGGFQSDGAFPSAETIAITLVRDGQMLATAVPSVAVAGPVVVGTRASGKPRKKTKPPTALTSTIDMLVEHGFMDPLTDAAFTELFEDVLGEEYEAGATTAADILSAVHENGTGIARGVVVHDHRFGNETDDVVAELTATLGDEPISFAQVGKREDALQIRAGDTVHWVSFVPGGLTAIVAWLNRRLEQAGAQRRIFELDTDADYHCYLVCSPTVVASMKRRRIRGIRLP